MTKNLGVSLQLYSLRNEIEEDFASTLSRVARIGFTKIEPWNFTERVEEYLRALSENRLSAPSAHVGLVGQSRRQIFEIAKKLGIKTLIEPIVDESQWQSKSDISKIANELNVASKEANEHGLVVGYHHHAWEISNKIEDCSALEFFETLLDREVILEVDAYWAHAGGASVPDLVARLGQRVKFLHIKDGKNIRGSASTFNERGELIKKPTDTREQVPAGKGEVPLAEVIARAPHALPIVEFDEYAGDIFEGIETSLKYIVSL